MDTGLLKVDNFIAEGEGKLLGLKLARDIGTRERPVEDGDGASEHTLHGLASQALSVATPLDGHGSGTAHVRDDDWGTNIAEDHH